MVDSKPSELDQLRRENARLIGLLETHGIAWSSGVSSADAVTSMACAGRAPAAVAPATGLPRLPITGAAAAQRGVQHPSSTELQRPGMARQRDLITSARQVFADLHASDFCIAPAVIKAVLDRCGK